MRICRDESWEPQNTIEKITDRQVQHEHCGTVPKVTVFELVPKFMMVNMQNLKNNKIEIKPYPTDAD